MTVAELIAKLQEQDGNDRVVVEDTEFFSYFEMDHVRNLKPGLVEIYRNFNKPPISEANPYDYLQSEV